MPPKIWKTESGDALHYSVGAIIKQNGKFLLLDRAIGPPFGFAVLAGHVNENEAPEVALLRTVAEESNLKASNFRLVYEGEVPVNWCVRGICSHHWSVYECDVAGEPSLIFLKAKSIGWYSIEEMKKLKLDPAVEYLFKKMKIF